VRAVQIYVASSIAQASFLAPDAQTFREFLDQQRAFVFFVTIYVGAGPDRRRSPGERAAALPVQAHHPP
jgi:hypothetical protein